MATVTLEPRNNETGSFFFVTPQDKRFDDRRFDESDIVLSRFSGEDDITETSFSGTGFTFEDSKGLIAPTGGTVTYISTSYADDEVYTPFSSLGSPLSIPLIKFAPLFSSDLDLHQKESLFFELTFSGDDRISIRYATPGSIGGDGIDAVRGRERHGGDDNIDVSRDASASGDLIRVRGTLHGGDDIVQGGSGNTTLWGDAYWADGGTVYCGMDTLRGGGGDDRLFGDVELFQTAKKIIYAADKLDGQDGDDRLDGNGGVDLLTGGKGHDTFVFTSAANSDANYDKITDFSHKDDTIELHSDVFAGLKAGTLEDFRFKVVKYGTQKEGVDKSDRILYDKDSGKLYFDQDGRLDKYKPIKFAEVKANTDISHDDFLIV